MSLWNVYLPVGAYSDQEKRQFADRVTSLYEAHGLPRFYVVTLAHWFRRREAVGEGEPGDPILMSSPAAQLAGDCGGEDSLAPARSPVQLVVERDSGVDQLQVREGLREVPELLAGGSDLL